MHGYKIFGYRVESEFDLRLPKIEISVCDVSIKAVDESTIDKACEECIEGSCFDISGQVLFVVSDESTILVHLVDEDAEGMMRLFLLGAVFSYVMYLRGRYAIHGSAIAIDGKAYVITGDSGAGKSSIARGFIDKGYKILSDDVSVVYKDDEVYVMPSYGSQKLWKDMMNCRELDTREYDKLANRFDKYCVPVGESYYGEPLVLGGVVFLEVSSSIASPGIRQISGPEALNYIINSTYRGGYIDNVASSHEHFKWATDIYMNGKFYELFRPLKGDTVYEQVNKVLEMI